MLTAKLRVSFKLHRVGMPGCLGKSYCHCQIRTQRILDADLIKLNLTTTKTQLGPFDGFEAVKAASTIDLIDIT